MPLIELFANDGRRTDGIKSEKMMSSMRAPGFLHRFFNTHYDAVVEN